MAMQLIGADGDFAGSDGGACRPGAEPARSRTRSWPTAREVPEHAAQGPVVGRREVRFLPGRAEDGDDWWPELGEPPGCLADASPDAVCARAGCGERSCVPHPFAYAADPDEPDDPDDESGPWHSRPDVRRATSVEDCDAAYGRLAALLGDRLGTPDPAGRPWPYEEAGAPIRHVRWWRGGAYALLDGDDAKSYGACRLPGVTARPRR
ncbi:hypothetical protein PV392_04460 [Streptomyces sp. ME03-5709C]|nr:hypothetical protein [Streptomyces sp. ME03-5709C]